MIRIVTTRGGVCGRVVNTSNSGCGGRGSSLVRLIVSLNKELYSTLSLFSQVYKWVPATYCRRITLRWTSIPSRGSSNTPGRACFMLSSGRLGLWLVCALYPQALGSSGRKKKKKKKKNRRPRRRHARGEGVSRASLVCLPRAYQGIFSHIFNYDSNHLITVALQMSTNVYAEVLAITGDLPARIFPETIAAIAKRVTGIRTPRPVLVSRSMNCKLALCRVLFK